MTRGLAGLTQNKVILLFTDQLLLLTLSDCGSFPSLVNLLLYRLHLGLNGLQLLFQLSIFLIARLSAYQISTFLLQLVFEFGRLNLKRLQLNAQVVVLG